MIKQNRISIKAVLIGFLVDYSGSLISGFIISIILGITIAIKGGNIIEISDSLELLIMLFIIGIIMTTLGGYVAGRISSFNEIEHGLYVGIISNISAMLIFGRGSSSLPSWYLISSIILVIPAAMIGGYFAKKSNGKYKNNI
ncbi:hypothetical protein R9X47_22645 [Wukongibacter baidiensis]|uniref:hypothetical protein n=1 Tax=Wukongibacter baidiensis TaxID=1723361 RepID=UPI003D7FFD4D